MIMGGNDRRGAEERPRLILAITGASGAVYGVRALQVLRELGSTEVHLIVTPAGARTLLDEMGLKVADISHQADMVHGHRDIGAPISSGSYRTIGMLVAPCSIRTLSGVAISNNAELVARAADVCLKERRRVVLLLRETPFHAGHIELMAQATRNGAIVMPPMPAFYHRPTSIEEIVDQTVGHALELLGIRSGLSRPWTGSPSTV
jgi:4-hydroxy-3-polyprenylbenzoate decarboxylase